MTQFGLMMDRQMSIPGLLDYAARLHGDREVVTNTVEGGLSRYTYREIHHRAKQLAQALERLGVKQGQCVGTLAWNTNRHLESYYGVSGAGMICHTINPRLFPEQIAYIINHAEDQVLLVDLTFLPLIHALKDKMPTVRAVIVMTDRAHMPADAADMLCYEELLAAESGDYGWPALDERTASSLCYTSGTTGNPKGVLYSHRSCVMHTYAMSLTDVSALRATDSVMPVVPMFHVNAWGLPYASPMTGAKLVFPGPHMSGEALADLINGEQVTFSAAVPTLWLGLLNHLKSSGQKVETLERVFIGGSACPRAMMEEFQRDYDVSVKHAWGMTEMSPLGTVNNPLPGFDDLDEEAQWQQRATQGRSFCGVDLRIVDDEGQELPHDGVAFGDLQVQGYWVCSDYFKGEGDAHKDGWFKTGDVATISPDGFMTITDRSKDVIKSGGEWISSIELENIAMAHPDVGEAAVIAIPHEKWDERPLLIIVRKPDTDPSPESILKVYDGKIAKWMIPNAVEFVDEIPHTATGKISKRTLRDTFADYRFSA